MIKHIITPSRNIFFERDESELVLYHHILELEAIELYKLSKIIESKNNIIVELNTDAISFISKKDKFEFESKDGLNIDGYYFDNNNKIPKYKKEEKQGKLCIAKMQFYKSIEKYDMQHRVWNITEDVKDNNFTPLVNKIIDPETHKIISSLITARAGCGKSHLIKTNSEKIRWIKN